MSTCVAIRDTRLSEEEAAGLVLCEAEGLAPLWEAEGLAPLWEAEGLALWDELVGVLANFKAFRFLWAGSCARRASGEETSLSCAVTVHATSRVCEDSRERE